MTTKRKWRQPSLPGFGGRSVDESLPVPCPGSCVGPFHVRMQVYCDACEQVHYASRSGRLDTAGLAMTACDKLREGGTETETANGGDSPVDPRSDEDMEEMYASHLLFHSHPFG